MVTKHICFKKNYFVPGTGKRKGFLEYCDKNLHVAGNTLVNEFNKKITRAELVLIEIFKELGTAVFFSP